MGNAVIRMSIDKSTGHGCFPPTVAVVGSNNTFVNKKPAVRKGDPYRIHCCKSCHVGMATGSSRVFVNGKGVTRRGDPITCGDTSSAGSSNVRAG